MTRDPEGRPNTWWDLRHVSVETGNPALVDEILSTEGVALRDRYETLDETRQVVNVSSDEPERMAKLLAGREADPRIRIECVPIRSIPQSSVAIKKGEHGIVPVAARHVQRRVTGL